MPKRTLPGVNIQWPWSQMLLSGEKTVETRSYPLPKKYEGVELALIETPGPRGKKEAGIEKARIIGTITFSGSFQYETKKQWLGDFDRHWVGPKDVLYGFKADKEKWGWVVSTVGQTTIQPPPEKRGIVFASECQV